EEVLDARIIGAVHNVRGINVIYSRDEHGGQRQRICERIAVAVEPPLCPGPAAGEVFHEGWAVAEGGRIPGISGADRDLERGFVPAFDGASIRALDGHVARAAAVNKGHV